MDQIKAILRNFHHSQSIKATARQLKVSKNTVRDYLRRALEHSNDVLKLLELEDSVSPNQLQKQVTRYICKARTFIT
jgi:DNA-binding NarL/FixJ family response regulator